MTAPSWDAVVVTLAGGERLRRAVRSIAAQEPSPVSIVVVANGTAEERLAPLPAARVIRLPRNLGFAAGSNRGALEGSAPFVALVNDDVVLAPGWAAALLAEVSDPAVASLQGEVRSADGGAIDSAGLELGPGLFAAPLRVPRSGPGEVPGVSATAALYRRSALLRADPAGDVFPAEYFAWYEDVDLALRLARAGFRARVVPAAGASHEGTATGSTMPFRRHRLLARNRRWTVARNFARPAPLRNLLADVRTLGLAAKRGPSALAGALAGVLEAFLVPPPRDPLALPRLDPAPLPELRAA